jgi:hypothetical protein
MKIEVDLPDKLVREIKDYALNERLDLRDAMAALLKLGLKARRTITNTPAQRVALPLVICKQRAELTPEQVSDTLLAQEAEWHS